MLKNILVKEPRLLELILKVLILLCLRFNSCKLPMEQLMLISSIALLLRFKFLRFLSMLKQSWKSMGPLMLLSWRSSISRLVKESRLVTFVIWFIDRIRLLMFRVWLKFVISDTLFELKSKKWRLGRDTRFSILEILLFWRFKYFIFSSPSRRGMCERPL